MIIDRLEKASLYQGVHKRLATAFDYLQKTDLGKVGPGTYEIEGRKVYVMVQQYDTKLKEKGRWEAHRKYIDVQFVHQGAELFGYANLRDLKEGPYDEAKDFLSLQGEGGGIFSGFPRGPSSSFFPRMPTCPGWPSPRPSR